MPADARVSAAELDAAEELYLGKIGRVKRRGKPDWGHDYTVTAVKEAEETGEIVLSLESVDRLPGGLPTAVVPNCPIRWFTPAAAPVSAPTA